MESEMSNQENVHRSSEAASKDLELAKLASTDYSKGSYSAALKTLNSLISQRSANDCPTELLCNKALTEFKLSGQRAIRQFQKRLYDLCGSAGIDPLRDSPKDAETFPLFYNYALLLHKCQQNFKILPVILNCLSTIDDFADDGNWKLFLFLALEVFLQTHQFHAAEEALGILEKKISNKPDSSTLDEDLASKHILYKIRLALASENVRSLKREEQALFSFGSPNSSVPGFPERARYEFLRCGFQSAIQILNIVGTQFTSDDSLSAIRLNSLACVYHAMGLHSTAISHLTQALRVNQAVLRAMNHSQPGSQSDGTPLASLSCNHHFTLLYNLGLQHLYARHPQIAFDCLIQVAQTFRSNPVIWLRLAECCVLIYQQTLPDHYGLEARSRVVEETVGSGIHRKVILGPGSERRFASSESAAMPIPTLEFASLCLTNALNLLPAGGPDSGLEVPALPGPPLKSAAEIANLQQSVLANAAYVSLVIGDPLKALSMAEKLMGMGQHISSAHRYLGRLYCAESLLILNRPGESVSVLAADESSVAVELPRRSDIHLVRVCDGNAAGAANPVGSLLEKPWEPSNSDKARAYMQYNLAAVHAFKCEVELAGTYLQQAVTTLSKLPEKAIPVETLYLKLYLDLLEGKIDEALRFVALKYRNILTLTPSFPLT